tara:strand:- start:779 stop:1528 length:750 start_codon:yes stop_codon:yes gene_type:complete
MISKYYTADVVPTIAASDQHVDAYAIGDVLFKATPFQVPRGIGRLISVFAQYRGPDGAYNPDPFELVFSRNEIYTAITANAAAATKNVHFFTEDFPSSSGTPIVLGSVKITATNAVKMGANAPAIVTESCNVVLNTDGVSANSPAGYDTMYVSGVTMGAGMDFRNTVNVNSDAGAQGTDQSNLIVQTVDPRLVFANGDVIHDEDDRLMGVVKTLSGTTIGMVEDLENAAVDEKKVYCINPMKLRLVFEK